MGGAGITLAIAVICSGASSAASTNETIVSGVAGSITMPPTTAPSSCSLKPSRVTTPKLPPPPRIAQNRSGCEPASTRRTSPSPVTISAPSIESIVRPSLRDRYPIPPPSVIPPIPTDGESPKPVARPWAAARVVYSPVVRPDPAQAVRPSTSSSNDRSSERSITKPSSITLSPETLCPPLRTDSSRPVRRANAIAAATSPALLTRTIAAGWRSIPP